MGKSKSRSDSHPSKYNNVPMQSGLRLGSKDVRDWLANNKTIQRAFKKYPSFYSEAKTNPKSAYEKFFKANPSILNKVKSNKNPFVSKLASNNPKSSIKNLDIGSNMYNYELGRITKAYKGEALKNRLKTFIANVPSSEKLKPQFEKIVNMIINE